MSKRKLLKKISSIDVLVMILGIVAMSIALYYTLLQ